MSLCGLSKSKGMEEVLVFILFWGKFKKCNDFRSVIRQTGVTVRNFSKLSYLCLKVICVRAMLTLPQLAWF